MRWLFSFIKLIKMFRTANLQHCIGGKMELSCDVPVGRTHYNLLWKLIQQYLIKFHTGTSKLVLWLMYLSAVTIIKGLRNSIYKKERFIMAYGFGGLSWWVDWHCGFRACGEAEQLSRSTGPRKPLTTPSSGSRGRGGLRFPVSPSRSCPNGIILPNRLHHRSVIPQTGNRAFNTWDFGDHSSSKL